MNKRRLGRGLSALIPDADEEDGVREVELGLIKPNPYQPRTEFDDQKLEELARSIEEHGVIQPIIVRKKDGGYELVAGERRWRAAKKAGIRKIPAIVKEYSDGQMLEIALLENLQREDLNPIEEATAYKQLIEDLGITQETLSKRIGKSRSVIANSIRLLNLPEEIQNLLAKGKITTGHARALLSLDNEEEQKQMAQKILERDLTVREIEKLVKKPKKQNKLSKKTNPLIIHLEDILKQFFGTKVKVRSGKNKGKIEIEYYSEEDLERILELVMGREERIFDNIP